MFCRVAHGMIVMIFAGRPVEQPKSHILQDPMLVLGLHGTEEYLRY